MKIRQILLASTILLLILAAEALAALPQLIPREVLLGNPERIQPELSPDGKLLAYLAPDKNNVLQVWVRTVGLQDDRQLTSEKKRGIEEYLWTYDGEHLAYLQDKDGDENFHLYAASLKTGVTRDLTPYRGIQAQPIALDENVPEELLVGMNLKDKRKHDVYRVNIRTGAVRFVASNPGNVSAWASDAQLRVRAAMATQPDGTYSLLARERGSGPWKTLRHWATGEEGEIIGFSADGRTLYATGSDHAPVEYIVYSDEGHGFVRPENLLHFIAKSEEFLARYLGGRLEPVGEIKGHAGVIK